MKRKGSMFSKKPLMALLILLALVMLPKTVVAEGTWEVVGRAGVSAGAACYTSLTFHGTTPYLAFMDGAHSDKATVMRFSGTAWEAVGTKGFSAGSACYTSLAFQGANPYVAFTDGTQHGRVTLMKYQGPPEPIPALNEWGLMALAGLACTVIWRRRSASL